MIHSDPDLWDLVGNSFYFWYSYLAKKPIHYYVNRFTDNCFSKLFYKPIPISFSALFTNDLVYKLKNQNRRLQLFLLLS